MRPYVGWSVGALAALLAATPFLMTVNPVAVAQSAKRAPGLEHVPTEGFGLISINVAKMHESEALKPFRESLEKGEKPLLKRMEAEYGLTIADVERLTVLLPSGAYTPGGSEMTFVTTRKAFDKPKVLKVWKATTEGSSQLAFCGGFGGVQFGQIGNLGNVFPGGPPGAIDVLQPEPAKKPAEAKDEKPKELDLEAPFYYSGPNSEHILVPVDEKTLVFLSPNGGGEIGLIASLLRKKPNGNLAEVMALADKHDIVAHFSGKPIKDYFQMIRQSHGEMPEGADIGPIPIQAPGAPGVPVAPGEKIEDGFTPYEPLAELEKATITFDLGITSKLSIVAKFPNAELAKKAETAAKTAMKDLLALMVEQRKELAASPAEKDFVPVLDFVKAGLEKATLKLDGTTLSLTASTDISAELKAAFVNLPVKIQEAMDRVKTQNNLKQIGVAVHNYHNSNNFMPKDVLNEEGKALLSWRIELLPFLGYSDLYAKIDRTKAWDDPVHKKLWDEMPETFKVGGRESKSSETFFQTIRTINWVGKDDPWQIDSHNVTLADVTDGTSNSAMCFEMETARNWMQPGDPIFDEKKLPKVGNPKTGKINVVMLDGAVHTLDAKKYADEKLRAIITINSGDEVDPKDFGGQ